MRIYKKNHTVGCGVINVLKNRNMVYIVLIFVGIVIIGIICFIGFLYSVLKALLEEEFDMFDKT